MDQDQFAKPHELSAVEVAFPAHVVDKLMPKMEDIPKEFKGWPGKSKWARFQADWFYRGSEIENLKLTPKEGINEKVALLHLQAIQESFEPKHEHKQAAVAYLMSLWFEDVSYEIGKETPD